MFENAIARNVARQNRHRIHSGAGKILSESFLQTRREVLNEGVFYFFGTQHSTDHIPNRKFTRRQMANVFRKQIDLGPSRLSIRPAATHFTFARHRPVIVVIRHCSQHLRIKICRKNPIEFQMIKWNAALARVSHRFREEFT